MALNLKLGNAVRNAASRAAESRNIDGLLAPGEEVVLTSSPYASRDAVTLRGFVLPETDGIWSGAADTTLDVRLRDVSPDRRYRLVIGALAFEVPAHRAQVWISVNGGERHRVLDHGSGWCMIHAEAAVQASGRVPTIHVQFHVDNPTSPSALGMGDDNRLLGYKIRSLQLEDIGSQADPAPAVPVQTVPLHASSAPPEGTPAHTINKLTQAPTETLRTLAARGPVWRLLLMDKNPLVRAVRWMRRLSRNVEEIRQQLSEVRGDSARQGQALAERIHAFESATIARELDRAESNPHVDAIIKRMEVNHGRMLQLEEAVLRLERFQERGRSELGAHLNAIVAGTEAIGRDVTAALFELRSTHDEIMLLMQGSENVDSRFAGVDQTLRMMQQQTEALARHEHAGFRELRERLELLVQQQSDETRKTNASIEQNLQARSDRQWNDQEEQRRHLMASLQQFESRYQVEMDQLGTLVQGALAQGQAQAEAQAQTLVQSLAHSVAAAQAALPQAPAVSEALAAPVDLRGEQAVELLAQLHEKADNGEIELRQALELLTQLHTKLDGEGEGRQTLALLGQLHEKLDNGEIEARQMLELLAATNERLESQQSLVTAAMARLSAVSGRVSRTALRRSDGWLIATGFGTFSCSESDDLLAMCLLDSGDVERGLRLFLGRVLKPGDVFVDAGANIGLHAVAAAHAVGEQGRVYAFEAMPRTCEHLRSSVRLSGVESQVEVVPVALGARDEDDRAFNIGAVAGHSSLYPLDEAVETIHVDVRRLDGMVGEAPVALVKIDVEGAELDVLAGMTALIERNPDMGLVAEYAVSHLGRAGTSEAEWEGFRARHGYALYRIDDLTGACVPLADFSQLRDQVSSNVLLCRDGSALPVNAAPGEAS